MWGFSGAARTWLGSRQRRAHGLKTWYYGWRASATGRARDGGLVVTSGLSVNEFALLYRLGPQPLAQVMGASVVRTGWQYLPALPPGGESVVHRLAPRTEG